MVAEATHSLESNLILEMDNIGALSVKCVRCFASLSSSLAAGAVEHQGSMSPLAIDNEYARFKIWAGNLGALQRGPSSLDVRLRDSVVMRQTVLRFLDELQDSLSQSRVYIILLRSKFVS